MTFLTVSEGRNPKVALSLDDFPTVFKDLQLTFQSLNRPGGRCFIFHFGRKMPRGSYLKFGFNITNNQNKVETYVSRTLWPHYSLVGNTWHSNLAYNVLQNQQETTVKFHKATVKKLSRDKKPCSTTQDDYINCKTTCGRKWASDYFKSTNQSFCWTHASEYMTLKNPNMKGCQTKKEADQVNKRFAIMWVVMAGECKCPEPCVFDEVELNSISYVDQNLGSFKGDQENEIFNDMDDEAYRRGVIGWKRSTSIFILGDDGKSATETEEFILIDAWTIIGIVGGALGLFLGFSCWDFAVTMVKYLETFLQQSSNNYWSLKLGLESVTRGPVCKYW